MFEPSVAAAGIAPEVEPLSSRVIPEPKKSSWDPVYDTGLPWPSVTLRLYPAAVPGFTRKSDFASPTLTSKAPFGDRPVFSSTTE